MSEKTPTVTVPHETGSNQSPLEAMLEQKMQEKRMSAWTDTDNLESMKDMQSYLQERNSHDMRVDQYSNESDPLDKGVFENDVFYDKESEVVYAVEAAGEVNGAQIYTISESYKNGAEKKTVMNAEDAKAYLTGKELVDAGSGRELLEEAASHAIPEAANSNQGPSEQNATATKNEAESKTPEEQRQGSASDHAEAAAEAARQAGDIAPLFGSNARLESNAQESITPEVKDATVIHTPEAHAAAAAEAQNSTTVEGAPTTPEAKQDSDEITEAIDEVVETITSDDQEGDAEQEATAETFRSRVGKKMADWVIGKLDRAKKFYKYGARATRVKNLQRQATNQEAVEELDVEDANSDNETETKNPFTVAAVLERTKENAGRTESEDFVVQNSEKGIYAVFDGMGGMGGNPRYAAETAAKTAVATFEHQLSQLKNITEEDVIKSMKYAFESARLKLQETSKVGDTVGSMVKFLEVNGQKMAAIAHAGDTRVLRYKQDGTIESLTDDQSRGNIVFNGFRNEDGAKDQYLLVPVEAGERFMISSDGITGDWEDQFLTDEEYQAAFQEVTALQSAQKFMDTSRKNDDKSVVIVDVE